MAAAADLARKMFHKVFPQRVLIVTSEILHAALSAEQWKRLDADVALPAKQLTELIDMIVDLVDKEHVRITTDFTKFHFGCAYLLNATCLRHQIDDAMKVALKQIITEVISLQDEMNGFLSPSQLERHFSSADEWVETSSNVKKDFLSKSATGWSYGGHQMGTDTDHALVEQKMLEFVDDLHVWNSFEIDRVKIGKIFGESGVSSTSGNRTQENRAHIAIDVGCVRFPTDRDPHFKITRLQVVVINRCKRGWVTQSDDSVMMMTLTSKSYTMSQDFQDLVAQWKKPFIESMRGKYEAWLAEWDD